MIGAFVVKRCRKSSSGLSTQTFWETVVAKVHHKFVHKFKVGNWPYSMFVASLFTCMLNETLFTENGSAPQQSMSSAEFSNHSAYSKIHLSKWRLTKLQVTLIEWLPAKVCPPITTPSSYWHQPRMHIWRVVNHQNNYMEATMVKFVMTTTIRMKIKKILFSNSEYGEALTFYSSICLFPIEGSWEVKLDENGCIWCPFKVSKSSPPSLS